MSSKSLLAFLNKLDIELKESSDLYRTATVNKKETTLTYKATTIKKTITTLIAYVDSNLTLQQELTTKQKKDAREYVKTIQKELTPELQKLTKNLKKAFKAAIEEPDSIKVTRTSITVTLLKVGNRDNYSKVQGIYKAHLDSFYQNFLGILEKKGHEKIVNNEGQLGLLRKSSSSASKETLVDTAGKAFNLEHTLDSSNINEFINDSIYRAMNEEWKSATEIEKAELSSLADRYDISGDLLTIMQDAENGTISLFIGSQILNVIESKREKAQMAELQKNLGKAIEKLGGIEDLDGSDSLVTGARKKLVKTLMKEFSTIKGLEITTENTKIIKSKGPVSTKNSGKTTRSSNRPGAFIPKKKITKSKRQAAPASTTPSLPTILGIIQQSLPETVRDNMEAPGLQNQTGRFASSVRATDINQTPQGFLSVGYTYMKEPYQTFEMGHVQGSTLRDPRKLIDASIREIAAEHALGRLYTRRV